jgi:hypothetical protein
MCGRNFLLSDFGYVLANLATTNKAMDEWRLRLDSAGQKGPEINLKGILIVVEGCFTAEISTTCFCSLALKPHNPQTSNASSWLQDPTLPANWHCVPRCMEGGSIQLTHGHRHCVHSLSALRPVVWRGSLNSSLSRLCLLRLEKQSDVGDVSLRYSDAVPHHDTVTVSRCATRVVILPC